jgi:hypothetical protein
MEFETGRRRSQTTVYRAVVEVKRDQHCGSFLASEQYEKSCSTSFIPDAGFAYTPPNIRSYAIPAGRPTHHSVMITLHQFWPNSSGSRGETSENGCRLGGGTAGDGGRALWGCARVCAARDTHHSGLPGATTAAAALVIDRLASSSSLRKPPLSGGGGGRSFARYCAHR